MLRGSKLAVPLVLLVCLVSTTSLAAGDRDFVLLLRCPQDSNSLCHWSPVTGWSKAWSSPRPDTVLDDYEVSADGSTIALGFYGHQAPGRLVLLDSDFHTISSLSEREGFGYHLSQVVSLHPDASVVLCTGPDPRCQSYSKSGSGPQSAEFEFPAGCLVPRFLRDGRAVCVMREEASSRVVIVVQERLGSSATIALATDLEEVLLIHDLTCLSESTFLLRQGSSLWAWKNGTLRLLEEDSLLELRALNGLAVYSTMLGATEDRSAEFRIRVVGGALRPRTVWASDIWSPSRLVALTNDELALYLVEDNEATHREPHRQIQLLSARSGASETLWSSHSQE